MYIKINKKRFVFWVDISFELQENKKNSLKHLFGVLKKKFEQIKGAFCCVSGDCDSDCVRVFMLN